MEDMLAATCAQPDLTAFIFHSHAINAPVATFAFAYTTLIRRNVPRLLSDLLKK